MPGQDTGSCINSTVRFVPSYSTHLKCKVNTQQGITSHHVWPPCDHDNKSDILPGNPPFWLNQSPHVTSHSIWCACHALFDHELRLWRSLLFDYCSAPALSLSCVFRTVMQAAASNGREAVLRWGGRSCMTGRQTLCGLKATGLLVNPLFSSSRWDLVIYWQPF